MTTTLSRTVRTHTPLEKCWAFLSDFSTTAQWDPGTVSCRRITPQAGGVGGVGTEYENVSKFMGHETTLQYRVTTFEPGRRFVLEGENSTVRSVDDLTFSEVDGQTEVVYQAHFTFKGAAKLAAPMLKLPLNQLADDAQRGLQTSLDAL